MRPCQVLAPNGNESLLFNRLFSLLGETKASQVWYEYRSDQFRQKHQPPKEGLDSNGEPTSEWLLQTLNIPVPKVKVIQASEKSLEDLKKEATAAPATLFILQADGNVQKLFHQIVAMGLPNVRLEGALRTLELQYAELPTAAYPDFQPIPIDEAALLEQKKSMFLQKRDGSFFSLQEQEELIGVAIHAVYRALEVKKTTTVAGVIQEIVQGLHDIRSRYLDVAAGKRYKSLADLSPERAGELADLMMDALSQVMELTEMVRQRLERKGIRLHGREVMTREWFDRLDEALDEAGKVKEEEGRGLQDFSSVVFELDPADTASSRMKLLLSVIPKSRLVDGKLEPVKGLFHLPLFEDFDFVFRETLGTLSQLPPVLSAYMEELRRWDERPYFHQVANLLDAAPDHVRNEFVSVMYKHNESYRVLLWNKDRNGNFTAYQAEGNRSSMVQSLMTAWKEKQKESPLILRGSDGTLRLNRALMDELKQKSIALSKIDNIELLLPRARVLLKELLEAHGIVLPEAALEYLLTRTDKWTKGTDKEGGLARQFSFAGDGKPNGVFAALVGAEEESAAGGITEGNPLYENERTLRILAKRVMPFLDKVYSISHTTVEGKKVWDYILHSSVTQQVQKFKERGALKQGGPVEVTVDPKSFTNHSGGAAGSDSAWDEVGRRHGFTNQVHYWHEDKTGKIPKPPKGNAQITDAQLEEGWKHVLKANETLGRKPAAYKSLLARNWFQVKNADAIYAVGKFDTKKGKWMVDGGTGWAVQMAIDNKKPVYFFDQEMSQQWYLYTGEGAGWKPVPTPALTKNYAGIGTRELNNVGKAEIENVFRKTLSEKNTMVVRPQVHNPFVTALLAHPFTKDNVLLKLLTSDPRLMDDFGVGLLEGMRQTQDGSEGVIREDMSDREQLVTAMNLFANGGRKTASYISLTHADKSRSPVFYGVPKLDVFEGTTARDAFLRIIQSEYRRITAEPELTTGQFEKGRQLFYFIPEMNFTRMQDLVTAGVLTQADMDLVWTAEGQLKPWGTQLPAFNKVIKHVQDKLVRNMRQQLSYYGVVGDEELMLDAGYLKRVMKQLGIRAQGKGKDRVFTAGNGTMALSPHRFRQMMGDYIAKDYALNAFIFNVSLSQLFYGDPAEAYKGAKPKGGRVPTVTDHIRSTMIEYEKRLAKDIAPRILPAWPEGATYQTVVLSDFTDKAPYLSHPAFGAIDATDAQEVITVEEHLDTLLYRGTLSKELHTEMVQVIRQSNGYYEFKDPRHKAVLMAISKPVYAGKRNARDGVFFQDYVKSAALVLYPPLVYGTPWDALRHRMETSGVRRAAFGSAYKVGAPVRPLTMFKEDGTLDPDSLDAGWDAAIVTLQRENLGIQQDRPYDEEKAAIGIVTQMDRLFTQGIDQMEFNFRGTTLTGRQLRERKEQTVVSIVDNRLNELTDKLGEEPGALYDWLIRQGNASGVGENNLLGLSMRVDNAPVVPLVFNGAATKFQRMALSAIKKAMSFKVPGASFVQATGAGFTRMQFDPADGRNRHRGIRYLAGYDPTKGLRTARLVNEEGKDDLNGPTVAPAEVLVPFAYIKRFFPKAQLEDFLDENGLVDTTKLPAEVRSMVLARIPNQGHNSMLPATIVGFLPDQVADTIIVPTAITKQMGSDFDVDKLYVYANKGGYRYARRSEEDALQHLTRLMQEKGRSPEEVQAALAALDSPEDQQAYQERFTHKEAIAAQLTTLFEEEAVEAELQQQVADLLNEFTLPMLEKLNESRYKQVRQELKASDSTHLYPAYALLKKALTAYNATFRVNQAKKVMAAFGDFYLAEWDRLKSERTFTRPEDAEEEEALMQDYFDLHWAVLTHKEVFQWMMSPLDQEDMKNEVRATAYDNFFDATYQLSSFLSQKDAKALVAKAANALTGNAMTEPHNLYMGFKMKEEGAIVTVETPITVKDDVTGDPVELLSFSGQGNATYYKEDYPAGDARWEKAKGEPRTRAQNLSILLSEILDHAKHRTIDAINLNTYTFNAFAAYTRLSSRGGYSLSLKYPSRLISQYVIRRFAEKMAQANDTLAGKWEGDARASVVNELRRELHDGLRKLDPNKDEVDLAREVSETHFNAYDLLQLLNTAPADRKADWYVAQLAVLDQFLAVDAAGKRLVEVQSHLSQLSKGPGKDIVGVMDSNNKVSRFGAYELSPGAVVLGAEDLLHTQAGHLQEASVRVTQALIGEEFPTEVFMANADKLLVLTNADAGAQLSGKAQADLYDAIVHHQYTTAAQDILWANPLNERRRLMTGDQSLAHRVQAFQATEAGRNNYLIRRLVPRMHESQAYGPHTLGYNGGMNNAEQENVRAWMDLLTSADETEKALGLDLVRYAMLTNHLTARWIPIAFLASSGVAQRMRQFKETGFAAAGLDHFMRQFVQHHPAYAQRVNADLSDLGYKYPYPPEIFQMPTTLEEGDITRYQRSTADGTDWVQFVSTYQNGLWFLYAHSGGGRYVRIDTLGDRNVTEYSNETHPRSVFPKNLAITKVVFSGDNTLLGPQQGGVRLNAKQAALVQHLFASHRGMAQKILRLKMNPHAEAWTEDMIRTFAGWIYLQGGRQDSMNLEVFPELMEAYTLMVGRTVEEIRLDTGLSWSPMAPQASTFPLDWGEADTEDLKRARVEQALHEGAEQVKGVLQAIVHQPSVPRHHQVLAAFLADNTPAIHAALPFSLQVVTTTGNTAGSWNPISNVLLLNAHDADPETLVHELLHAYQNMALDAWNTTRYPGRLSRAIRNMVENYLALKDPSLVEPIVDSYLKTAEGLAQNKRLVEAVGKLNMLYEEAREAWKSAPDSVKNEFSRNDQFYIDYALKSLAEFQVMSQSHPGFMRFLNQTQSLEMINAQPVSLLEQIAAALRAFIDALAEALGMDIHKDSVLMGALQQNFTIQQELSRFYGAANGTESPFNPTVPPPPAGLPPTGPVAPGTTPGDVTGEVTTPVLPPVQPEGEIQYSEEQRKAIQAIQIFAAQNKHLDRQNKRRLSLKERTYVLSGAGGTGKTTVTKEVIHQLEVQGLRVAVFTTSHAARLVAKRAIGRQVYTIHAGLQFRPDPQESVRQGKEVFKGPKRGYDDLRMSEQVPKAFKALDGADVILIDESSMLPEQMYQALEEANEKNATIVLIGDYAQLPAVGEDAADLFTTLLNQTHHKTVLTHNFRSTIPDVLQNIQAYRSWVDQIMNNKHHGARHAISPTPAFPAYVSDSVVHLSSSAAFMQAYYDRFDPADVTNQVIIVYRNEVRRTVNQMVRKKLFGENVPATFVPGDHLIATSEVQLYNVPDAFFAETGEKQLFNGERVVFRDRAQRQMYVEALGLSLNAEIWTVLHPESGVEVDVVHVPEMETVLDRLNRSKWGNTYAYYDGASKEMVLKDKDLIHYFGGDRVFYGDFAERKAELEKYIARLEFAYAVTSHKSQGMEFRHVYVMEKDILGVGKATIENKARSLYTAVSRSKETTTTLTDRPPVTLPQAFAQQVQSLAATFGQQGQELSFATRQEAQQAVDLADASDALEGEISFGATRYFVKMRAATKAARNATPLEKAILLLRDRLNEMYNGLNDLREKDVRSERLAKIHELNAQIEQLTQMQDMRLVAGVGRRHLEWIREVLEGNVQEPNAIMSAYRLADMWANIFDLLYTTESGVSIIPDPDIDAVNAEAQQLKMRLVNGLMRDVIISRAGVPITTADFSANIQDEHIGMSYSMAMYRSKGKVAQELSLVLTGAARTRDEEITRVVRRIQDMTQKYGTVLNGLVEVGADSLGLIGPYTQKWYNYLKEQKEKRLAVIEKSRELQKTNKGAASNMRIAAWQRYQREVLKNALIVDVRHLFDYQTGDPVNSPEAQAERARLEAEVGAAQAQALIDKAERRFKKYLDVLQGMRDKLEAQVAAGTMTDAQMTVALKSFQSSVSPVTALNNLHGVGKLNSFNKGDSWLVMVPRASAQEFHSTQWATMQASPQALAAYGELSALLKELKRYLPLHVQWQMPPNFFPYVARHLIKDVMSVTDYVKTMPKRFVEDLTGFAANSRDGIPIQYVDKDGRNVENYSTNVPAVLEVFANMALHYKHFSRVKDYADMVHAQIEEIHKSRLITGDEGLTSVRNMAEYNFDYLVYRNPKKNEAKLGKIYSHNPILHRRASQRVKELIDQKADLERRYADGSVEPQDYLEQLKVIDEELAKYEGMTLYGSRIGDKLISINQLKALSYNPFSAVANLGFGLLTAYTYANGRMDYTMKDYSQALWLMKTATAKFFTFGGLQSPDTRKIFNIIERMGVMGDVVDSQYGQTKNTLTKSKWWKAIGPYNMMKGSDYFMKGSVTLAMLLHKKVRVTEGGVDKEITLLEALDEEGNWDSARFGENKEWYSEDTSEQRQWNKFRDKVLRVNTIIMGNQDKNSPKLLSRTVMGRLIGQFRLSWLPEGFATRFEDEREDPYLERTIKGRYRTYGDLGLVGSLTVLGRQLLSVVTKADPFTGVTIKKGEERVLLSESEVDIANMRRNFAGAALTLSLYGAIVALKAVLSGEDDEEDKTALQLLLNLIIRQKQDMMMYASPSVFDTVTRNLIPATDVINDYGRLIAATGKLMWDEDYDMEQWLLKMTKAGLPVPQATLVNKVKFMTERDIDDVVK